jgi:hypothetical protein
MDKATIMSASPRPISAGKWLFVVLLCMAAAALAVELARPGEPALAEMSSAAASPDGAVMAVAAQLSGDTYGLYLLDTRRGTMAVYQFQPSKRTLKLMAVRGYGFDLQLDEYNTEPSPNEIRQLVQQQKRLADANDRK